MKLVVIAKSTVSGGNNESKAVPAGKIKYYANRRIAAFVADAYNISFDLTISTQQVLEVDGQFFEVKRATDKASDEILSLKRDDIYTVNIVDMHNYSDDPSDCRIFVNIPKNKYCHDFNRNLKLYISNTGDRFLVGKEIKLEQTPPEYKETEEITDTAVSRTHTRLVDEAQHKAKEYQQAELELQTRQAELLRLKKELDQQLDLLREQKSLLGEDQRAGSFFSPKF